MRSRVIRSLIFGLSAALALLPGVAGASMVDRIAAIVGDDVIALSEVYDLGGEFIEERCQGGSDACRREAELEVLDSLIMTALIRQELQRLSLDVTASDVDRTIDQIAADNGMDRAALRQQVQAAGMHWTTYREQLTEQVRQMKFNEAVIRPRISVSEDEMRDLYNRTVRDFEGPATYELEALAVQVPADGGQQALVDTVQELREVRQALVGGEREWAATVQEVDTGVYKGRQGRMGSFPEGGMLPQVESAVTGTAVGGYTEPVVVQGTVMLIRVVNRSESDVLPFEQVEERLRSNLYEQKLEQELEAWYQQTRRRAALTVLLEDV